MAIKINFDVVHNPEVPTIILAKKNGRKIGQLNAKAIEVSDSLNDASEITFVVNKYIDGEKCEHWEQIVNFKLVYCVEWDMWFEITVELDEATETKKTVYCTQLGNAELSQIMLYTIEINTENDIAREDYKTPTILYNPWDTSASLLHRIMEKAQHYTIIHVDETIANIQRTFTFDSISIYDAFQEIAEEIHCLFVLHSNSDENGNIQRTISVYDLESNCVTCGHRGEFTRICPQCGGTDINEGYGNDTTIFISSDELAEDIQLTSDTKAIKNCFKLEGGDDLMTATIRNCNPNGSEYLWYISDALKEDMSPELVAKITEYDELFNTYQRSHNISLNETLLLQYNALVTKYLPYNSDLEKINIPVVGYPALMNAYYNTIDLSQFLQHTLMPSAEMIETTAANEAAKLTTANLSPVSIDSIATLSVATADNAVLSMANVIIDSRYRVKVASSELERKQEQYQLWTGKFTVTNYANADDTATSSIISIVVDDNYGAFVRQRLQKSLRDDDTDDLSISGLFAKEHDDFVNELKKYSLSCLKSFYNSCQTCIDILIEQGTGNKSTWDGEEQNLYEDLYLPYLAKFAAIEAEIKVRQSEVDLIIGVYDAYGDLKTYGVQNYLEEARLSIQEVLDFHNYLGDDLWLEFCTFRREDKLSNKNYISDGLNNAELFKRAYEFIEVAQKEIYKSAELQHSIATSLKNLLTIEKFQPLVNDFEVGNWLRIMVDDELYKLRLIHYSIDYDDLNNISVEFSDVVKANSTVKSIQDVLKQATSMATSYDYVQRQAKQGEESRKFLNNWVSKGLDITATKIMNGATNQTQTWDEHGMLFKKYDDVTETFEDIQLKIINSTLAITDDNWKTVKTAVGAYYYFHPETGKLTRAYGINAETLVGQLIIGEQLGIYNEAGTLTFDTSGFKVSSKDGTNSFRVDPNSSILLAINNGKQDVFFIDNSGKLHIVGEGSGLEMTNNADIVGMQSQITMNSDAIKLRVTSDEMYAAIETEIDKVKIEVGNDTTGLSSRIEANTNSIALEVERALSAEQSLSGSITATAQDIALEVTRATNAETSLGSRITLTEQNIALKVSKGDISSQISVETGQVSIGSNRLVIDSTNFKLSGSGTITASGSITSKSGSTKTSVSSGSLSFYYSDGLAGSLTASQQASDGSTYHNVVELRVGQDAFIKTIGNTYYYAFNNGLNPRGFTERFYYQGNIAVYDSILNFRGSYAGRHGINFYDLDNVRHCMIDTLGVLDEDTKWLHLQADKGIWVEGDFYVEGTKNRIVTTKTYGDVLLNAMESTCAVFSDLGSAVLDDTGICYIFFHPKFIETISETHDYLVFTTPINDCVITNIEKKKDGFIVKGKPNTTFDWMVFGRQLGYESSYLEKGNVIREERLPDIDESVFYEDDKAADLSESYMDEFEDTLDEQALAYLNDYKQEVTNYDY